jgi:hypothetical protein
MKTEKEPIRFLLQLFSICTHFYTCDLNTKKEGEEEEEEEKKKKLLETSAAVDEYDE